MDVDQKIIFIQKIQKSIADLKKDISALKVLAQPVSPDNAIGRLTRMEAINSKSISEATLYKAQNRLSRLERTMRQLDDPDYGLCHECEAPIPFERLMALPETTLCVDCAERLLG
jgi:DnaK suppressor protein